MKPDYIFLLIDDNAIDQLVTKQLLKKVLDVPEVNIANNGREGIQWITDYKKDPDHPLIILLDIQMPEMNGIEFLQKYESLSEELKSGNKIFMLTSSLDADEIKRIKNNKYVTGFLNKPFPVNDFGKIIYTDF
ncbi:response regulator [Flavobacterium sp.]|uniref:response regulator n=1 Tax=Flavobacterium sp. TaxID=239 RepID=UPI003D6AFCD6